MDAGDADVRSFFPKPFGSAILISADFELAWAWHHAKRARNQMKEAKKLAMRARANIPRILDLCGKYDIPITWAIVGHLFLNGCSKNGRLAHSNLKRIPYHENEYWEFNTGDWFDDDPCTDWKSSLEWYAPDLVNRILDAKAGHEIACHTFSHIDCRDSICLPEVLIAEINECKSCADKYGIKLQSFVHPGHTIGNLSTLKKLGFTSFRTDYRNALSLPCRHESGLWEFRTTAEIYHRDEWAVNYHIYRYNKIVDRGVQNKRVIYFRFHPSFAEIVVDKILEPIFAYISQLRERGKLLVTGTKEYVAYLNSVHQSKVS
jgi:peptidoglycan/xylan/chitin deacetylase (PgdA/CDA1 family)